MMGFAWDWSTAGFFLISLAMAIAVRDVRDAGILGLVLVALAILTKVAIVVLGILAFQSYWQDFGATVVVSIAVLIILFAPRWVKRRKQDR